MKQFAAVVASVLLYAIGSAAMDDPTVALSGVQDLTPDNFDKFVNGAKHALVEFYAPWCGHCKHMTPEFKKLGEAVQSNPKLAGRVVVGKVDADAHRSLGEKFGVQGFPTIKWFSRGKPVTSEGAEDYNEDRTSDKFLEYILQKLEADTGFARVPALDTLAVKYAGAADKAARSSVLAEVEAAVKDVEEDAKANAELYIKLMKKALEGGKEALSKEAARLERMIGSGSVAAAKLDEMSRKSSVLGAFLEDAKAEE